MAKILLNSIVAVLVFTLTGCHDPDSGKSQLLPCRLKVEQHLQTDAGEINYVEQMAMNRQAYRQALELLIKYYRDSGNNKIDNLCFLCQPHHEQYDSRTSQTKEFREHEVRSYRARLSRDVRQEQTP